MKTYLVTGGAGFIGSNFIIYMLNKYKDIKIVNADKLTYAGNTENLKSVQDDPRYSFYKTDICDFDAINNIFSENEIDYVVNFAAESHVDRSILQPQIFTKTNVEGTVNLLECAKNAWQIDDDAYKQGVKFLQVSTDEVYGSLGTSGYFTEATPINPHSPYSASKASADMFVKAFFDTYKFPVNITRCSNNYGPYQLSEKLIPLVLKNTLTHKAIPVYGDGLQVRDWIYVEDHCKAIDIVIKNGIAGEIYNIGGHNERTNKDVVKQIIAYVKGTADEKLITHITDRKGHDRRYGIDPKKINNTLGWCTETPFEEGLKKTVDWYIANAGWLGIENEM